MINIIHVNIIHAMVPHAMKTVYSIIWGRLDW